MIGASVVAALAMLSAGGPKFVELVQEVQIERDYAPSVGRHPEPAPQPFVSVRYLTPEQRAEPIIVPPAPVYVSPPKENEQKAGVGETVSFNASPIYDENGIPTRNSTTSTATPSYITSVPTEPAAGSATGSTAVPNYGTPIH